MEKLTFAILLAKACVLLMKKKQYDIYYFTHSHHKRILLLLLYLNVRLTGTITYPLIFPVN
jgi:hypothetical protein